MKIYLILLLIPLCVEGYSTYPRRYSRDTLGGSCPSQCRCMAISHRGTRDLYDVWARASEWSDKGDSDLIGDVMLSDQPTANGRRMVCQGLRRLPVPFPKDIIKLTIYGDSSGSFQRLSETSSRDQNRYSHLISDTQIRHINKDSFHGSSRLQEITMSGNNIGIMYPYTFHHLRSLTVLNFPNNNVRHLSAAVFSGLTNLEELKLSDNMIRFLPSMVFNYLQKVRVLNLNGNKIRYIQRNLFKSMKSLEVLDLSRNNISDLFDDVFDQNTELKELLLSGNRLWKIRPRWFKNLQNLRSLSLRGNIIKSIAPKSFSDLINLEELLLSANHISLISQGAFQNLRDLKILDLATNDILDIPTTCFFDMDALEELYFGNNKLLYLRNGTFQFAKKLLRLDLSRNVIEYIEREALHPMRMLQYLDVSHNKMRKINRLTVHGLEDLKEVILDHNFITDIDDEAFKTSPAEQLSKITYISLKNNNLRKLGSDSLQGLPQLKSLNLGNNKLKRIHSLALSNLGNLKILSLNNNKLRSLNNGMFSNLRSLVELDLSSNKIRSIPTKVFSGLDSLESLNLGVNGVHEISEGALSQLKYLINLDLTGNKLLNFNLSLVATLQQLSTLDINQNYLFWIDIPDTFIPQLNELILTSNNLKTIPSNVRSIMAPSGVVAITGNPLSCDCNMKWLIDPKTVGEVRIDKMDDVICKTPNKLHGRRVADLLEDDMTCSAHDLQNDQPALLCDEMSLRKKSPYTSKTGKKASINRHSTIYDEKGKPVANGILINNDWVLTFGSYFNNPTRRAKADTFSVRAGRTKKSRKVINIILHPLVSMNMQQYNVALIRLQSSDLTKRIQFPCLMTKKQFESMSKIIPRVTITTRISARKPFSKLKTRKGRIGSKCINENFICAKIKGTKQGRQQNMLINGSPLYLGQPGDSRLAGIGVDIRRTNDHEYTFIPVWAVSDWIGDVISEYDTKCVIDKKGNSVCKNLKLPTLSDMVILLQPMEEH